MTRQMLVAAIMVLGIIFPLQGASGSAERSKKGFEMLEGRWLRPDGGYIVQIRSVDSSGKIEAGYFNPRPINVSKAQAARESGKIKVFIELRDTGYPGSTYTLTYDPKDDVLRGVYYQAAMRQSFDVYFTRMK